MPEYIKQKLFDLNERYNKSINQGNSIYPRIQFGSNSLYVKYKIDEKIPDVNDLFIEKNFDKIIEILRNKIICGLTSDEKKYIDLYIITAMEHENNPPWNNSVIKVMKDKMKFQKDYYEKLVNENINHENDDNIVPGSLLIN